jgi:hypothetical protein
MGISDLARAERSIADDASRDIRDGQGYLRELGVDVSRGKPRPDEECPFLVLKQSNGGLKHYPCTRRLDTPIAVILGEDNWIPVREGLDPSAHNVSQWLEYIEAAFGKASHATARRNEPDSPIRTFVRYSAWDEVAEALGRRYPVPTLD